MLAFPIVNTYICAYTFGVSNSGDECLSIGR